MNNMMADFAQKRKVLSDEALPEEFKLALAESLQHGIFSSVWTVFSLAVNDCEIYLTKDFSASFPSKSSWKGTSSLCSWGQILIPFQSVFEFSIQ